MKIRDRLCCQATISAAVALLLLLTLLTIPASGVVRRGWRKLKPTASRLECGRQLHDLQSKWLQSSLVLVGHWSAADERPPGDARTRRFNVTVTVRSVLKSAIATPTTPTPRSRRRVTELSNGSRILVGEFSGVLARSQHSHQRLQCTPSRLADRRKGYILFLEPTPEPGYYRHSFLPAKLNRRSLKKLSRVSCSRSNNCPQAPLLMKAIPKGVRTNAARRQISVGFVCRARGRPAPTVRWLKDGVEMGFSKRVKAQFKKRSNSITSRLQVKSMGLSNAGNYTCLFTNLLGSVNATFEIGVDDILSAGRKSLSPSGSGMSTSYLCDTANQTYCMNGGTCIVNSLDGRLQCKCPSDYSGYICEKPNVYIGNVVA